MTYSHASVALTYHEISAPVLHSYTVTPEKFEEHVRIALDTAARPVFTFDDGHVSALEGARTLESFAQHGTFFITAGWVGNKPGYVSAREILALASSSHRIGAHGWSHKFLTHCTTEELKRELDDAKHKLEDILGAPVTHMSAPGGRHNRRILDAAACAGFTEFYTSEPTAIVRQFGNLRVAGRLNIDNAIPTDTYRELLRFDSAELRLRLRRYQIRSVIRTVIGDASYHRLWKLLTGFEGQDG